MSIAVYGATGFVGRLVTEKLSGHAAGLVLIGRDPARLARERDRNHRSTVRVASAGDSAALTAALEGCAVVVNCAPAALCGDAVIQAALTAGVHYLDASSEQDFLRGVFDRYDVEARRRRLAVVTAMGFDYAIGDCLARIAARNQGALEEVVVAYVVEGSEVAGNSVRFAVSTPRGHEVVYRSGRWRRVPFEIDYASFDFPSPVGRRQMSRYGSGEVITVPRHTQTDAVRTLITSASLCPHPALLPLFPILRPLVGVALKTPLSHVLAAAARLLPRGRTHAGEDVRGVPPSFMIAVETRGKDGSKGRAVAQGGDFHRVTAATLAWGALDLARESGDKNQKNQTNQKNGTLPPAAAFDPEGLLNGLRDEGVRWTVASQERRHSSAAPRMP